MNETELILTRNEKKYVLSKLRMARMIISLIGKDISSKDVNSTSEALVFTSIGLDDAIINLIERIDGGKITYHMFNTIKFILTEFIHFVEDYQNECQFSK